MEYTFLESPKLSWTEWKSYFYKVKNSQISAILCASTQFKMWNSSCSLPPIFCHHEAIFLRPSEKMGWGSPGLSHVNGVWRSLTLMHLPMMSPRKMPWPWLHSFQQMLENGEQRGGTWLKVITSFLSHEHLLASSQLPFSAMILPTGNPFCFYARQTWGYLVLRNLTLTFKITYTNKRAIC